MMNPAFEEWRKAHPFKGSLSFDPLFSYIREKAEASSPEAPCMYRYFLDSLKERSQLSGVITDPAVLEKESDAVNKLMNVVFSPVFQDSSIVAAVTPVSGIPFFLSSEARRLFMGGAGDFAHHAFLNDKSEEKARIANLYLFIIEKIHNVCRQYAHPSMVTIKDPVTGLPRYFNMTLDSRFVTVHTDKPVKPLSLEDIQFIKNNFNDPGALSRLIKPCDYEMRGFIILHFTDITKTQVMSFLERSLIEQDSIVSSEGFMSLQEHLRTLFQKPNIYAGLAALDKETIFLLNMGCDMQKNCIFSDSRHLPLAEFAGTVYEKAIGNNTILRVEDTKNLEPVSRIEEMMFDQGVKSFIIPPLSYQGKTLGTLKLASEEKNAFTPKDMLLMEQIQPLFSMALNRALTDFEHLVQGVIKEECTAIHPSVEWRFRKAAINYLEEIQAGRQAEIESILFRDVYPVYGVSDIRGSTDERNRAIQKDLEKQLLLAGDIAKEALEKKPLMVLSELNNRICDEIERIKGGIRSGDELYVVKFLKEEVEAVFTHIKGYGKNVADAITAYENAIDHKAGTVYGLRKKFENSVAMLNHRLASYLDREEEEMQALFPHYYERHRTDGVDYLIYAGRDLVESGEFDKIYLKNLRLWQIKVACGMAWHTEKLKPDLEIPLDTAHLILVQDTPLSIRFRYDEKRFDPDGAYDTRHAIIKSRIDKAEVLDTGERLTQPGKVAIVYSQAEEAAEMEQHIEFLKKQGYLTGNTEKLDLGDLPGVQGLKALRAGIDLNAGHLFRNKHV